MKMGSNEYWKGYTDAQKQAEKNWARAMIKKNSDFINIIENARGMVKGIGPKSHHALIEYVVDEIMGETSIQVDIDKKERSRIVKELANTKWSSLSDKQIIMIQNILSEK